MAASTGPGSALTPTAPGAVAPPPAGNAVVPAAGNAVSRAARRPAANAVALSLAAHSYLDEIKREMELLNADLQALNDALATLKAGATSMDAIIRNVDELSELFEAPATTRSAAKAASAVAMMIEEMVGAAQRHGHEAQVLNAQAYLNLQAVLQVQENQRAMGAGPRLLATAGRL